MGWNKKISVLAWLCALAAIVNSIAVNTDDLLIVTTDATSNLNTNEITTEEPLTPVTITKMDITSDISARFAHSVVVAHLHNPAERAQEATFKFLMPENAFISGFHMTLEGKVYKAYVKEKEEAKKEYTEAVRQGLTTAHVAADARNSRHFIVSVNVGPSSTAEFNLVYEEQLTRRHDVYNHVINLHPATLVPDLSVKIHIHETQKITTLRVPEIRTGNEIDASKDSPLNTNVHTNRISDEEVIIVFKPTLEEQKRLAEIYIEKVKESKLEDTTDSPVVESEERTEKTLGQFVVQYDVDRAPEGEILVSDGYFLQSFVPESLPTINKHVVFVADTSMSLSAAEIKQLQKSLRLMLDELKGGDYFSMVRAAEFAKVYKLEDVDFSTNISDPFALGYYEEYHAPIVPLPPYPVTPENVAKAKIIINDFHAHGGTDFYRAFSVAIDLIQRGVGVTLESNEHYLIENVTDIIFHKYNNTGENAATEEKDAKQYEPMIIFLTDGFSMSGVVNHREFLDKIAAINHGPRKASIFIMAQGEYADEGLLRPLALTNNGFMKHIYNEKDAPLQIRDVFRQISSPVLTHVTFTYPSEQVDSDTLTKSSFRTIYRGSEVIVAGKIHGGITELTPEISGFSATVGQGFVRVPYKVHPVLRISPNANKKPIERIWAHLKIKQLLDEMHHNVYDENTKENPLKTKAIEISLENQLVTEVTSLIVVKPDATYTMITETFREPDTPPAPPVHTPEIDYSNIDEAFYSKLLIESLHAHFPNFNYTTGNPGDISNAEAFSTNFQLEELNITFYPLVDFIQTGPHDDNRPTMAGIGFFTINRLQDPDLSIYHLQSFDWIKPLIKTKRPDEIVLPIIGTHVHMKLSADAEVPKAPGGDEACSNAIGGSTGKCVYLSRCDAARNITPAQYATTYCLINNEFAGICCP